MKTNAAVQQDVIAESSYEPSIDATNIGVVAKIEDAWGRAAEVDAATVGLIVTGNRVELNGKVRTWPERNEAERAACTRRVAS